MKLSRHHIFAGVLVAGLAASSLAARQPQSARPVQRAARKSVGEVRGVWVVRSALTSPERIRRVVVHAKRHDLNTLFVQVRGRGDAYYQSDLEPRAEALAKQPDEFDPLAEIIVKAQAAKLRVHLWVNAMYVWSSKTPPRSPQHLARAHPDWLAVDASGRRCRLGHSKVFVCPTHPEARAHLLAVVRDLATRYEVDGVHLDYIRYAGQEFCFCNRCLAGFARSVNQPVEDAKVDRVRLQRLRRLRNSEWQSYRRRQITSLVGDVRQALAEARPEAKLSAAVIAWGRYHPDFRRSEAYSRVGQDWYGWMEDGLVDAVLPMTYQSSTASYGAWVKGVQKKWPQFPVWYGVPAYRISPQSAANKVGAVRKMGGKGWVLFSYGAVTREGANDRYLRELSARIGPPPQRPDPVSVETSGSQVSRR